MDRLPRVVALAVMALACAAISRARADAQSLPKHQPAAAGTRDTGSVLSWFTSPPQFGLPAETAPKEPVLTVAAPTVLLSTVGAPMVVVPTPTSLPDLIAKVIRLSAKSNGPTEHKPRVTARVNGEPIFSDQVVSAILP
jgi:hypothetical protein